MEAKTERIGFLVYFRLRVRIWGLLGQGIGDLDLGLTILFKATTRNYKKHEILQSELDNLQPRT